MDKFIGGVVIGFALSFLGSVIFSGIERNIKHDIVMDCIKRGTLKAYNETYECKKVGD